MKLDDSSNAFPGPDVRLQELPAPELIGLTQFEHDGERAIGVAAGLERSVADLPPVAAHENGRSQFVLSLDQLGRQMEFELLLLRLHPQDDVAFPDVLIGVRQNLGHATGERRHDLEPFQAPFDHFGPVLRHGQFFSRCVQSRRGRLDAESTRDELGIRRRINPVKLLLEPVLVLGQLELRLRFTDLAPGGRNVRGMLFQLGKDLIALDAGNDFAGGYGAASGDGDVAKLARNGRSQKRSSSRKHQGWKPPHQEFRVVVVEMLAGGWGDEFWGRFSVWSGICAR
jgi:hypothetical protein